MYFKLVRVFAIGVIAVGLVTTANAQQSGPVAQSADGGKQTVDVGKYEYDGHYAICHGVSGTGQGIEPYWSYLSKTRSYVASPDVYKVIAESNNTRVILATWKPGQRDAWHSHPPAAESHET